MKGKGYTILETMIVLAVSATIFISAVAAFGGRQQDIQFSQAVRDFDAKIADLLNDVSTGFFNNDGQVSCSVSTPLSADSGPTVTSAASAGQGTNNDCVFIGKVLQLHPKATGTLPTSASTMYVYNIVGRRDRPSGQSVSSLQEAQPVAIGPANAGDTGLSEQIEVVTLDWGLRVTDIKTTSVDDFGAVGFFTSFSTTLAQTVGTTTISNNQSVRYGAIPNSVLGSDSDGSIGQNQVEFTSLIGTITDDSTLPQAARQNLVDLTGSQSITICLQNAEQNKRAAIIVGVDGSTTTEIQFDNYDRTLCGV